MTSAVSSTWRSIEDDLVHRQRPLGLPAGDEPLQVVSVGSPQGSSVGCASFMPLPRPVDRRRLPTRRPPRRRLSGSRSRSMAAVSHCSSLSSAVGSGADPTWVRSSPTSCAGPLGEQPHHGVEGLRLELLGGEAAEQVGHARVGGVDGLLHGRVGHEDAERGRVELARRRAPRSGSSAPRPSHPWRTWRSTSSSGLSRSSAARGARTGARARSGAEAASRSRRGRAQQHLPQLLRRHPGARRPPPSGTGRAPARWGARGSPPPRPPRLGPGPPAVPRSAAPRARSTRNLRKGTAASTEAARPRRVAGWPGRQGRPRRAGRPR